MYNQDTYTALNIQCMKQGFAIFNPVKSDNGLGEIQYICDAKEWSEDQGFNIPQLESDMQGVELAKKMGFEFNSDNPYKIIKWPELK